MKKAFSTVACMQADYIQIAQACKEYKITGVEIRLGDDNSVLGLRGTKEIQALREYFREEGLEVTNIGSSLALREYDENVLESAEEVINHASILNARGVRVFLGNFAARVDSDIIKPDYEGIVRMLKELCDKAQRKDVEIWVETHNEFATGKVLKKLIEDVRRENLKIIWDIMHPMEDGEGIEETWLSIGDRIAHVHIKDGFDRLDETWRDYQYTKLGEGALPVCSVLDLLERAGFDGYVSFEWEAAWRQELKGYENTLHWVLRQYADYIKQYKANKICSIGEKWNKTDATGKNDMSAFAFSRYGAEAIIDNRIANGALKRYEIEAMIESGRTYHISVPFKEFDTKSRNVAYGLVTLYGKEGIETRRLYLSEEVCGRLSLIFRSEEETSLRLDLGIKREGKVVWYRPMLRQQEPKTERKVKIASVYIKGIERTPYEEKLKQIEKSFDKAAADGADLVAYAEDINSDSTDRSFEESFENIDGKYCTLMRGKAKEYGCYAYFTFHELDENGSRRNTAVLVGRDGKIVGRYCKTHLSLGEYEGGLVPGDSYSVFDTDFGKVGMLICWDAYFPEPARAMAFQGAEILLVSTAGNPTYRHFARAMENGVYVVVSCRSGVPDAGIAPTKIINPQGKVLAETCEDGEAAVAVINLEEEPYIGWLSVGPSNAVPRNIYMHEYRDDM